MTQSSRAPLQLPDTIEDAGILVGWSLEHEYRSPPIGFHYGDDRFTPASGFLNPILFEGEGHLMTIAPTGSGKGTGCIIPTLLRHPGPVIVIDPKGENAAVTARRRAELGQKVIVLDPLGIVDGETDRLNPFDLLDKNSATLTDDVAMLMNILVPEDVAPRDRFWVSRAQQLLIGLTLHLIIDHGPEHHHLGALRAAINQGPARLNEVAQAMARSPHPDVQAIASNFQIPAPETFGGILSFAQDALSFLRGDLIQAATSESTFSYDEITRGDPLSLYLIIPSDKLESHAPLLKIWIGSLMAAISSRQAPPPQPTLFVLDEAAQLGPLPQLRQAITLLRGYGLQTWSFWQDVSQLQRLYPADWETMVNNCKVLQAFGANNMNAASGMASLTGYPRPWEILDLDYNEMLLLIGGDEAVISQRPDYLKDPLFRGMFDANPRHDLSREILPKPQKPQRVYTRPPKPARSPSGDPIHPPVPLWSEWERNAVGEVIGIRRLEGDALGKKIRASLKSPRLVEWGGWPIVKGKWEDLNPIAATNSLQRIWPRLVPNFGHGLTGITAVRRLPLSFYPEAWLCEGCCQEKAGFAGFLTWIETPDRVVHLTGTSPPIHQLNAEAPLRLDDEATAKQYLEFFCSAVHGQAGAFRVVSSAKELYYGKLPDAPIPEDVLARIRPCELKREKGDEKSGGGDAKRAKAAWTAACCVQYGSSVYASEFEIGTDGMVQMLGDEVLIDGQKFLITLFTAGMRTILAPVESPDDDDTGSEDG
ncbi:MAG: type IV secretory system conjugative DNA transfer family protein [Verrucomicrobiae bacterium]|nr:type IV secretory system conjugative DNA transfer family protein [Verrucomicrobiae bacterium]